MAVRWARRALGASSVLTSASRSGKISRLPLVVTVRCSSAVAYKRRDAAPHTSQSSGITAEPSESQAVGTDQPEFTTLEDRVTKQTLSAIIHDPMNLKHMSSVQASVLPLLPDLARPYDPEDTCDTARDLLVKARTGTGKTLAFLVPAIEARVKTLEEKVKKAIDDSGLRSDRNLERRALQGQARQEVGTLILSPTRELATQIAKEAQKLSSRHDGFEVKLFVGGSSKRAQMQDWMRSNRRDIVVGTPGRIRDVLENEPSVTKALAKTRLLVLDEADTLLEMGFRQEIEAIADFLPPTPERQTFLFSATVSPAIQQVARQTLAKNHLFINCVSEDSSPVHAHVPQYHTVLPSAAEQLPHVLRLLAHDQLINPGKSKSIVFLPTTKMTRLFTTFLEELTNYLPANRRTRIFEIHSGRTQEARTKASRLFREDKSGASILVSSDVSARGVDYPGVTRVIQVGIPSNSTQYIHRVGRTGRGTEKFGRADLVLLPWEAGFASWQLSGIPLKPLTTQELTSQVQTLAQQHDTDSHTFLQQRNFIASHSSHVPFSNAVLPGLEQIEPSLDSLKKVIDQDAVKETLTSLLGYYAGKISELRVSKSAILEGLQAWTVDGCGLDTPPHLSSSFLAKVGLSPGSDGRGGGGFNRGGSNRGGFNRGGFNKSGSNKGGPSEGGFNRGGFNKGGFNKGGFNKGGFNRGQYSEGGSDPSYSSSGYNKADAKPKYPTNRWEGRGKQSSTRPRSSSDAWFN